MKSQQLSNDQQSAHAQTASHAKPAATHQVHPVHQFRHTLGNRAVGRFIQAKLKVSQPRDVFEQEADRVANEVMRMPDTNGEKLTGIGHGPSSSLQRSKCKEEKEEAEPAFKQITGVSRAPAPTLQHCCTKCEEDEEIQDLHRKTLGNSDKNRSSENHASFTEAQIHNLRGGGEPLSESLRAYFEPRFGHDFSAVRVHTDSEASRAATDISARAFTHTEHIFFGPGQYLPDSNDGRQLLAHELTHTIQQGAIQGGNSLTTLHSAAAAPSVQRKPLKNPFRAQIVATTDTPRKAAPVETWHNANAEGCRTDLLEPGVDITITDEFAGGAGFFAQNLPKMAVKALHRQNWIYAKAKDVERIPEVQSRSAPGPKQESETETTWTARVDQLANAIYRSDKEKVITLLNEGGVDEALELLRRVQESTDAKGQVSPVAYLGDDFSLDLSNEEELRVAVVAHTIKLSRGDWSGSLEDTYDALIAAAKRLGMFAPGAAIVYLVGRGGEQIKAIVEQRRTEQVGEFVAEYDRMKAAEKDPLGMFKQRLKQKTLEVLVRNEAAVEKHRESLSGKHSSDEAWKRLETVVVPQAIRYAQLGTLEEKLTSLITHTTKAVSYAEAGQDDLAGVEYSEERGEPPDDAWWRPNRLPFGGGGANFPPSIEEIKDALEQGKEHLASVQEQRAELKMRFPLVKALRPALVEKLAKGPASSDATAAAEFRGNAFVDLQKQVFDVALSAIKMLRTDVGGDDARLYSFKPLVNEVKSELMLGVDQEAKIDAWVKEQEDRDENIRVVTTVLSVAIIPLMFLGPVGALVAALVGGLAAAHGADVAGEQYTAAKAGMGGKDLTEKSLQDTRWEANLALLDLVLAGLDVAAAIKVVATTRRVGKGTLVVDDVAEETRRLEEAAENAPASGGEELAEETSRKAKRGGEAARAGFGIPGLPGCRPGSVHCPIDYLRNEFPKLYRRRETAEFAKYIDPAAAEIELEIRRSLRHDMTILTGDAMYVQYLDKVAEGNWSKPFKKAVALARSPGTDHRILSVNGKPMKWPLDDIGSPWVVHHDPPLNWTAVSEGPHLWHPMPYRVHDAAHAWWHDLSRRLRDRIRRAGRQFDEDLDIRDL